MILNEVQAGSCLEVAARLRRRVETVVQTWEARVREHVPTPSQLPTSLLRDSLPTWLKRLADLLEDPNSGFECHKLKLTSKDHGQQRLELGLKLSELMREYAILRETLFYVLEAEGALSGHARDTIYKAIEISVQAAVEEYTRLVNQPTRRLYVLHALWQRVLASLLIIGAAAALQYVLWFAVRPFAYLFFYPAVLIASVVASAPIAIVLAILGAEYIFAEPQFSWVTFSEPLTWIRIASFALTSYLMMRLTREMIVSRQTAYEALNIQDQARQKAERTVAALDGLLASAPFGVAFLDSELKYVRVNEPLARWNGHSIEAHFGKAVQEILPDGEPFEAMLRDVLRTGKPIPCFEFEYSPRDGSNQTRCFLSSYYPVRTPGGEVIGVAALVLDNTELKHAEQELVEQSKRLDLALHAGEIGIWVWNTQTGAIHWSERQFEIFGWPRGRAPASFDELRPLINSEDMVYVQRKISEALVTGQDIQTEFRVRRPDGSVRWVQANARPCTDEQGYRVVLIGTNIDITSRKLAEMSRQQFVSTLTHDLRTPLTAARMGAQLTARNSENPERVRAHAAKVVQSLDRADKMIRDLLDANRLQVGQSIPLQCEAMDLRDLVAQTVEDQTVIYGSRFQIEDGEQVRGTWDPANLRRLLDNLLSNAVKYGASDREITIVAKDRGQRAELSVHNYGRPIPQEELGKLFDYLHRSPQAPGLHKAGWGIGLTLVKGVAQAHGGEVLVSSSPESGTLFTVLLPKRHLDPALEA